MRIGKSGQFPRENGKILNFFGGEGYLIKENVSIKGEGLTIQKEGRVMLKHLMILSVVLLLAGCVSKSEHEAVLDELEEIRQQMDICRTTVAELEDLPTNRLARARQAETDGDEGAAEKEFRALVDQYPDSEEAAVAAQALAALERKREERQREEERRKQEEERRRRLGFKALTASNRLEVGVVNVQVRSVEIRNRWVADRYDSRWFYWDARRGSKYIVADVRISSTMHNPKLPPIFVYRVVGDQLAQVGRMAYKFYKWKNYGTYLGNYADYGNDFAHTETIPFTAALEIDEARIKEPLFVLVGRTPCFQRVHDQYSRPEIRYSPTECEDQDYVTLDGAERGLGVIKIFNKDAL